MTDPLRDDETTCFDGFHSIECPGCGMTTEERDEGVTLTREPGLREALDTIERLKRALTVAHHRPHDNLGPADPDSGFPTCSGCEAILTEPDAALASKERP